MLTSTWNETSEKKSRSRVFRSKPENNRFSILFEMLQSQHGTQFHFQNAKYCRIQIILIKAFVSSTFNPSEELMSFKISALPLTTSLLKKLPCLKTQVE